VSTAAYDLHTHYLQACPEVASTTFSIRRRLVDVRDAGDYRAIGKWLSIGLVTGPPIGSQKGPLPLVASGRHDVIPGGRVAASLFVPRKIIETDERWPFMLEREPSTHAAYDLRFLRIARSRSMSELARTEILSSASESEPSVWASF
jgi:hypothetical protein